MDEIRKINDLVSSRGNIKGNYPYDDNRDIEINFDDLYNVNEVKEKEKTEFLDRLNGAETVLDPHNVKLIKNDNYASFTTIDGAAASRRKVDYTEEELEEMARIVQREADIDAGRAGAVAVAEEIRNRVLYKGDSTFMPDTVHDVLYAKNQYTPKDASSPLAGTEEARDDVKELCRNVLEGKEWVFGQDNVLSHASHEGNELYNSQEGVEGSQNMGSFYYDNVNRTQTFYAVGDASEVTSSGSLYAESPNGRPFLKM